MADARSAAKPRREPGLCQAGDLFRRTRGMKGWLVFERRLEKGRDFRAFGLPCSHPSFSSRVLFSHLLHICRYPESPPETNQSLEEENHPGEKTSAGEHQIHGFWCVGFLCGVCFALFSSPAFLSRLSPLHLSCIFSPVQKRASLRPSKTTPWSIVPTFSLLPKLQTSEAIFILQRQYGFCLKRGTFLSCGGVIPPGANSSRCP